MEWLENNLPLQNLVADNLALNVFAPIPVGSDNMNGNNYDSSKVGMEYDLSGGASTQGT